MRSRGVLVCAAAVATALVVAGCVAPLFEPLEEPLIFRPRPLDEAGARALSRASRIEEVPVPTTDGVTLHGWLKRPEQWLPGTPHPLVIMYGGVGHTGLEYREEFWGSVGAYLAALDESDLATASSAAGSSTSR